MMRVQMLVHSGRLDVKIAPGDVINVDDATGAMWIENGIARLPRGTKQAVSPKRRRTKKAVKQDGFGSRD